METGRNTMMIRKLFQKALFVGRLSYDATVADLQSAFPHALRIDLPKNPNGGGRGFAFVSVEDEAAATSFINNPPSILGSTVVIRESISKPQREKNAPSSSLYVGNLPMNAQEDDLRAIAPKATEIRVLRNEFNVFAFVEFETVEDATEVLTENPNLRIKDNEVRLDYGKPKVRRREY